MNPRSTAGFTILEVLMAVVVLGIGLVALAGGAGMTTRQIGRGRSITRASQIATQRLENLRRAAAIRNASGQQCQNSNFASGSATTTAYPGPGFTETWTVSSGGTGVPRTVSDSVSYRRTGGRSWFKMTTIIGCK